MFPTAPFLVGLAVAPLAKRLVTPVVRGAVKTSVGLAMEVKQAAHEASEGFSDIAAEATAEMIGAEAAGVGGNSSTRGTVTKPRETTESAGSKNKTAK